jgi:hypothetical protein
MLDLENMEYGQYSYSTEAGEEETYTTSITSSMRKKKNKNPKRFSDEQIKSLETMFETESRLEPRKKLQLARELGLQPRQVAIWFQNKRARWKSKQLEREYNKLQNSYNNLASKFESMKKERQTLLIQVLISNYQLVFSIQICLLEWTSMYTIEFLNFCPVLTIYLMCQLNSKSWIVISRSVNLVECQFSSKSLST